MSHVTLIFTRSGKIGSRLLRLILGSRWSHCGIVTPDGTVIEAQMRGVIERPLADMLAESKRHEYVNVPCPVADAVIAAARSQLGKRYDWLGLLGYGLRSSRVQDAERWFCSELVAWAFAYSGYPLMRSSAWRISPPMLYLPIWRLDG
ncbi:hypothetical protein CO615_03975 [Lysobacteraceae bacterium NML75-0749]|nr:hypothetical protein CO615_03975 [Xanthomonadaceae bacterium NML75-0749]